MAFSIPKGTRYLKMVWASTPCFFRRGSNFTPLHSQSEGLSIMLSSISGVILGPEFLAAFDSMCSFSRFISCHGMEEKSKSD